MENKEQKKEILDKSTRRVVISSFLFLCATFIYFLPLVQSPFTYALGEEIILFLLFIVMTLIISYFIYSVFFRILVKTEKEDRKFMFLIFFSIISILFAIFEPSLLSLIIEKLFY